MRLSIRRVRRAPRGAAPTAFLLPRSPETHLLTAILLRALADAPTSPATRAWCASPDFDFVCELADLPADRLRELAVRQPEVVKACLRHAL